MQPASSIAIIAATPLLMLWQSSNPSKGTSPGKSEYNTQILITEVNAHLGNKTPEALELLCDFTLDLDRNAVFTERWIDYIAEHCGECADVHLARGRVARFRGDETGMRREFEAARAAAGNSQDLERISRKIEQVMK